jgi:hypothetical protein
MTEPTPPYCNLAVEIEINENVVSSGKPCDLYLNLGQDTNNRYGGFHSFPQHFQETVAVVV